MIYKLENGTLTHVPFRHVKVSRKRPNKDEPIIFEVIVHYTEPGMSSFGGRFATEAEAMATMWRLYAEEMSS